jgi:ferredoxin
MIMNIKTIKLIYFSPTKTTKKIVEGISQGVQIDTIEHLDLTPPEAKSQKFDEIHYELAIIGTPVYSGRIPLDAVQRLQRLKVTKTLAVIVVVYGNREYDDALLELRNLVIEVGFKPIAGGAFIGEHSYANESTPIANGRPDSEDLNKAREFGMMIRDKIRDIHAFNEIYPLHVPGNFPYREKGKTSKTSPITQKTLCTICKKCATVCPTAAITVEDTVITDQNVCILCCACVKNCPTGARVIEDQRIKQVAERLSVNCSRRKEPEIYII